MKCFWCRRALDFSDCLIDYVIPQATSKIVLKSMVKELLLGPEFSIHDYGNWVPACSSCIKRRAAGAHRQMAALPGFFDIVRNRRAAVEAKVRQLEGEQVLVSSLRALIEKSERGEITREDIENIAAPFLREVEGRQGGTMEFRLSRSVRLVLAPDGVRRVPQSEIRYEELAETIVESGDWKKRKSVEDLREGPCFGEGQSRRPGAGA